MNRLIIVEGLPCSGKSTTSKYIADRIGAVFYDEGSGDHPTDYEFHAFIENREINSFSPEEQLLINRMLFPKQPDILFHCTYSAENCLTNYCSTKSMIFCRGKLRVP